MTKKLKLKSVIFDKEGTLTLIGKSNGEVIAYDDPNNVLIAIGKYLNGYNTPEQIYKKLLHEGYTLNEDDVNNIIKNIFSKNGLLINNNTLLLSERDLLKYDRLLHFYMSFSNVNFVEAQKMQQKLFNSNILILGVGGTGGHTAHSLIASGVRNMTLVDFDNIEITNVTRQMLYDETNLGLPKIKIAKKKLLNINPEAHIHTISKEIKTISDVKRLLETNKFDFIVNTMDNPRGQIRYILDKAIYDSEIPYIFDGSSGSCVVVGPTIKKGKTRSYSELLPYKETSTEITKLNDENYVTNVIEPMNGTVGQLTAYEVIKYITGCSELATWEKRVKLDMDKLEVNIYDYEENDIL